MKIAIGTKNPAKINAVETVLKRVWPDAVFTAVAVPSGVGDMPMSDEETLRGARNRAIAARTQANADVGVGLEGGVHPEPFGLTLMGWAVVTDANGRCGIGGTARIPLPTPIAARVRNGEELGPVMDDILKETGVSKRGGAVGALTNGLVLRGDSFETAVAYALAPFLPTGLYPPE